MVAGSPQGPFRKAVRVSWAKRQGIAVLVYSYDYHHNFNSEPAVELLELEFPATNIGGVPGSPPLANQMYLFQGDPVLKVVNAGGDPSTPIVNPVSPAMKANLRAWSILPWHDVSSTEGGQRFRGNALVWFNIKTMKTGDDAPHLKSTIKVTTPRNPNSSHTVTPDPEYIPFKNDADFDAFVASGFQILGPDGFAFALIPGFDVFGDPDEPGNWSFPTEAEAEFWATKGSNDGFYTVHTYIGPDHDVVDTGNYVWSLAFVTYRNRIDFPHDSQNEPLWPPPAPDDGDIISIIELSDNLHPGDGPQTVTITLNTLTGVATGVVA